MKLKAFITMALLSVSALGSCQTGGSTNVTELTKEQKDNLKYLYNGISFSPKRNPAFRKETRRKKEPNPCRGRKPEASSTRLH